MGGAAGVKDIGTILGEDKSAKLMPLLLLYDFGCCLSCSLSGVGSPRTDLTVQLFFTSSGTLR